MDYQGQFPIDTKRNKNSILDPDSGLPQGVFEGSDLQSYVPVEWFKDVATLGLPIPHFRTFVSSGTGGEQSKVSFSEEGLRLYQEEAIAHFKQVLQELFPPDTKISGFSLIPTVAEWASSSLAQMVDWFAKEFDVTYVRTLNELPHDRPIWILGTVAHFVNVMKTENGLPLHKDSIVFETGGSKNIGVEKKDFYSDLQKFFHLKDKNIWSEYGMCELACQAYGPGNGVWKFANHVRCYVQKPDHSFSLKGIGCLTVWDPKRIDCPHPIRTQDLVEITDGGIRYLHRLKTSPLRGCSLLVSDAGSIKSSTHSEKNMREIKISFDDRVADRATLFHEFADKFFKDSKVIQSLGSEIGSTHAAQKTLENLHSEITNSDWPKILENATQQKPIADEWLFILPNNHSLVGIYPLAVAYVLGLNVNVRLPRNFSSDHSLIFLFYQGLSKRPGAHFELSSPQIQIGQDDLSPRIGSILCFGTDETVQQIKKMSQLPTVGFGNHIVALYTDRLTPEQARTVVEEAFSLGQRGCLSARLLFCEQPVNSIQIETLRNEFGKYWQTHFDIETQTALQHQFISLARFFGDDIQWKEQSALFPILNAIDTELANLDFSTLVSRHPFHLPIIYGVPENVLKESHSLLREQGIYLYALDQKPSQPGWDGTLNGQPLFVTSSL